MTLNILIRDGKQYSDNHMAATQKFHSVKHSDTTSDFTLIKYGKAMKKFRLGMKLLFQT